MTTGILCGLGAQDNGMCKYQSSLQQQRHFLKAKNSEGTYTCTCTAHHKKKTYVTLSLVISPGVEEEPIGVGMEHQLRQVAVSLGEKKREYIVPGLRTTKTSSC